VPVDETDLPSAEPARRPGEGAGDPLARIIDTVRAVTGVDFTHYRLATLLRRIERRTRAAGLATMDDYAALLRRDSAEAVALYQDTLIATTRFFRDGDAFRTLADEAVDGLLAGCGPDGAIRVWVCGCATGEEAYSIAILFAEARERLGHDADVTIYATDIDRDHLDLAGLGEYPDSIAEDVSEERLARFFVRRGERYAVGPDIRRMVVFAPHDIRRDPPFAGLDLISCRNVLIHMDQPARRAALVRLQRALRKDGFLFLGKDETPDDLQPDVHGLGAHAKLFRGRRAAHAAASDDGIGAGGVLLTLTDVTERNAWRREVQGARDDAERALALSERRHRILVQSLHEGLVMRSVDGTVHIANPMAERLMAGPAAVLLDPRAKPLDEGRLSGDPRRGGPGPRFVDADGARLDGPPPAAQAAAGGRPVIERVVGVAGDDAAASPLRWLRVSSLPIAAPDGQVESVVSSVTDITAMKALERELSVALDAKERFMASASHDLRQPVQALMLLSGLLLREPLGEAARKLADQLRVSVGSLGTLLDCMLDISKLEAGLVSPELAPVDLALLMERLHRDFLPVAAASGLRLTMVPARRTLRTDAALLERVLRNLLANALRYTPQGRVLFGARRFRGGLRLEVWDTGIGVAETQIDRIFQDFYQVGNAARDRREGLGMGLSIAKRLVAMLGGAIHVASEFGRGSCFAVSLPVEDDVADDGPGADGGPEGATGGGDALVLLVEDDAVIRMALGMMLEGWGYRVLEAGTASEAAGHLDGGAAPDLVLADYRLPDSATGLMVMDTVRRRLGRDVPGVLLTGDTSPERLHEAVNAQCALLHKPIQPFALRDTVRAALRGAGGGAAPSQGSGKA